MQFSTKKIWSLNKSFLESPSVLGVLSVSSGEDGGDSRAPRPHPDPSAFQAGAPGSVSFLGPGLSLLQLLVITGFQEKRLRSCAARDGASSAWGSPDRQGESAVVKTGGEELE